MHPTGDSFKYGEAFEKFIEDVIFPASHYKILEKTHNYQQNSARYVWSSLKPDFKFKAIHSGKVFYIEAKFRSRYNDQDKLELLNAKQYERYKFYDNPRTPVFLLVGAEGNPDQPKLISLIPLRELKYLDVYRSVIENYRIQATFCPDFLLKTDQPISSSTKAPFLKDIVSGLTIKHNNTKRTSILPWVLGLLVIAVFSAFFLTQSPNVEIKNDESFLLQEKVKEYYNAIELNNSEVFNYYLNDHLDRWYEHRNINLDFVKKNSDKYNKKYPYREMEIQWPSYKEHQLPNGDISLSYDVIYNLKSKPTDPYKEFYLSIKSIWSADYKIKSMYEVKLSK